MIGTTNRRELIDPALLRPGRLEVQLEIGLPDEKGREEIFAIHTAEMRENKLMSSEVKLSELANMTKNYSGAEIEGLVKAAASLAIAEKISMVKGVPEVKKDRFGKTLEPKIEMRHFVAAMEDVLPNFGRPKELEEKPVILDWGAKHRGVVEELTKQVKLSRMSKSTQLLTVLLHPQGGEGRGYGLTSLAYWTAVSNNFPFAKKISIEDLISCGGDYGRVDKISKIFEDAYRSTSSIIILDGLERILNYMTGPRFNSAVLEALNCYLNRKPSNPDCRLLIIATTSNYNAIEKLELVPSFNAVIEVSPVEHVDEIKTILEEMEIKMEKAEVEGLAAGMPKVGIKHFLLMVDAVKSSMEDTRAVTTGEFLEACKSLTFFKEK